jgi:hypothetical protein
MSARAETIRIPGRGSSHRPHWYRVLAAMLVAAVIGLTAYVVATRSSSPASVRPATGSAPERVVPVSGDGVRVGGTSIYRYHPLPAVNVASGQSGGAGGGSSAGNGSGSGGGSHVGGGPRVGGGGTFKFHPLP